MKWVSKTEVQYLKKKKLDSSLASEEMKISPESDQLIVKKKNITIHVLNVTLKIFF